jgi:Ca2+-binding EF-hand superfamily protein
MPTELHRDKFDRLFEIFDVNRDGYISQDDFDSVVHKVATAEHGSSNEAHVHAIREAAARFWTGIKEHAEIDRMGRVSRASFHDALHDAFLQGGRFDELIRPAGEAWFALYDVDDDGRVGRREYEVLQRSLGRSAADIGRAFAALDHDRDGYLTLEDFTARLNEYFHSDDPHAQGNWLF